MNEHRWADRRAEKFVEDVFTTGTGEKAVRLEMRDGRERGLGGWGKSAMLVMAKALVREAVYRGRTGRLEGA